MTSASETVSSVTYDVPAYHVDMVCAAVDKANRRLARSDNPDRFTMCVGAAFAVRDRTPGFPTMVREYVPVTLNTPIISVGPWMFAATRRYDPVAQVYVTFTHTSLTGYTPPEDGICQHCGVRRARTVVHIVRNTDTGEYRQVGSSCLEMFLGVQPMTWPLLFAHKIGEDIDDAELRFGGAGVGTDIAEVREVIALAWVLSDRGTDYVTREVADFRRRVATADVVKTALFRAHTVRDGSERRGLREAMQAAGRLAGAPDNVVDEILASISTLPEGTYYDNVSQLTGRDYVGAGSVGLVASLVTVYARALRRRAAEAADPAVAGYLGEPKELLTGIEATVLGVRPIDSDFGSGTSWLIKFRADSGHTLTWFASRRQEVATGDRVHITRARVKSHNRYDGIDETAIKLVKLTTLSSAQQTA